MEKTNPEKRAEFIVRIMGNDLAKRYIDINIDHWDSNEDYRIISRTESREYWQEVKEYSKKFNNLIIK